jgi:hypothetical protein
VRLVLLAVYADQVKFIYFTDFLCQEHPLLGNHRVLFIILFYVEVVSYDVKLHRVFFIPKTIPLTRTSSVFFFSITFERCEVKSDK